MAAWGCSTDVAEQPLNDDVPYDPRQELSNVELVNPFIGTGGLAYFAANCFPGAVAPFGMVQVSPDTTRESGASWFEHAAGYHYEDTLLLGFSHNRLQGVSTPDLGAVSFMPAIDEPSALVTIDARRTPFRHDDEVAEPGYYAVQLRELGVQVELTATSRVAHHRYTYDGDVARLVIDLGHAPPETEVRDAWLMVDAAAQTVDGWVETDGRFTGRAIGGARTYVSARLSARFTFDTWSAGVLGAESERQGPRIGAVLSFDERAVDAQVGLSYVSVDGARANREAEAPSWDFDGMRNATRDRWADELSAIEFEGGTGEQREIMATALYHSRVVPSTHMDVDGAYRGFDGEVHHAQGFEYHANYSMWDTYRTVHPLLSLTNPQRQRDMVRSLIAVAEDGGYLPRWTQGHAYAGGTVGSPVDVVIADSYLRGVTDFDVNQALDFMVKTVEDPPPADHPFAGREALAYYLAEGYVPNDQESRSVSHTLEFAIADAAIARLAAAIGRDAVAATFEPRGRNYTTLWDAEHLVFRPRLSDGSWVSPFSPTVYEDQGAYYGGNAVQYSLLVPHDMAGLMELFGSAEALAARLDQLFTEAQAEIDAGQPIAGLVPSLFYNHANEVVIHAGYLFLQAGRRDLAAKWIHWISEAYYGTSPDGIAGNEDAGTLSAWYVWSALGLYPVPGTDQYLVGRPMFPRAAVSVPGGTLVIDAPHARPNRPYVYQVTLNGEVLTEPWLRHDQIAGGGTLHFDVGPTPP